MADTLGVLVNPSNPSTARSTVDAQAAAEALSKKLILAKARTARDIETGFGHFGQQKVRAISVESDPFLTARREQIVALAAAHSLPAIYSHREFAEVGGLVSYGTSLPDAYRQIGIYVGRILNGEQPAGLPIMQATKFEMVINLKTAKALDLEVPLHLQQLADEVIE